MLLPKTPAILFFLICALLGACSDDNNPVYPIERTILDVSIAKRCADCYLLRWRHPYETKDLQNYYIWIDTAVVNDSVHSPSQWQVDKASAAIPYSSRGEGDSIDLTNLLSSFLKRDSLHIAIWARYGGSDQGMVRHYYVHFGDDMPPSMLSIRDSSVADTIWIEWDRPTDQSDFYKTEEKSGPIAGYYVILKAANASEDIRNANLKITAGENADNIKRFQGFKKENGKTALVASDSLIKNHLRFAILDGKGFDTTDAQSNSWQLEISGLKPESTYEITMEAWDIAGNPSDPTPSAYIKTTDGIEPPIASEFWFYLDESDKLPRLDSNRLVLFWKRSAGAKTYIVEQHNGDAFETLQRVASIDSAYYNVIYRLQNDSMAFSQYGDYVSDTLRWISPGEEITLRLRAKNSSGHYSQAFISAVKVSEGGLKCPSDLDFMPVKKDDSFFCMERLQHKTENKFNTNVLYIDAEKTCKDFNARLCSIDEWEAACGLNYGVIEERNFQPVNFLSSHCGVRTGNAVSANYADERDKLCVSPDGIRDLPGQLQEWVAGKNNKPLLKGASYALFEDAGITELAQCKNRYAPTRERPRYTTDTVWLYKNGSRTDTLFMRDTLRAHSGFLPPDSLRNTIMRYELRSLEGDFLGVDYFDLAEYNRRGGKVWLDTAYWNGLIYEPKDTLRAYISGEEKIPASNFFLDPTVGFRCCADGK